MPRELRQQDWESVLGDVLSATAQHIRDANDHKKYCDLANERFYHHRFSCLLSERYKEKNVDMWAEHLLTPEGKTEGNFNWSPDALDLNNVEATRDLALTGQRGNHDFVVNAVPRVRVEWKGPKMYTKRDIAKVCLKLLHRVSPDEPKLVCAIITGAKKGNKRHVEALEERFKCMLHFACDVIGCDDIASLNLFVYVATILDAEPHKYHWRQMTDIDAKWSAI
jgi:hypothetical protein